MYSLNRTEKNYVDKLIASAILSDEDILQLQDPEFHTQLTLDCSVVLDIQVFDSERLGLLELYTRGGHIRDTYEASRRSETNFWELIKGTDINSLCV